MKKKIRIIKTFFAFLVLILCINSCNKKDSLFHSVKNDNTIGNAFFKSEEQKILVDSSYNFNAFSFESISGKKIYGFWGIINDTLYFVNPIYNYEKCITKFPILYLGKDQNNLIGFPQSNCSIIPIPFSVINKYEIEIISKVDKIYVVKHTGIESHIKNSDYAIFTLSLDYGILDFEYFSFESNFELAWCMPNEHYWFKGGLDASFCGVGCLYGS